MEKMLKQCGAEDVPEAVMLKLLEAKNNYVEELLEQCVVLSRHREEKTKTKRKITRDDLALALEMQEAKHISPRKELFDHFMVGKSTLNVDVNEMKPAKDGLKLPESGNFTVLPNGKDKQIFDIHQASNGMSWKSAAPAPGERSDFVKYNTKRAPSAKALDIVLDAP